MKAKRILKYLSLACFIVLAAVLVVEASMPGEVSSSHSGAVSNAIQSTTEKVEQAVGGSGEVSSGMLSNWSEFSYYVRKGIGHFGAFMVLAVFGSIAFPLVANSKAEGAALSLILGLSIALSTELIQLRVEGRYGSADDVLLDSLGYFAGFALTMVIALISRLIGSSRHKNKSKSQ